VAAHKAGRDPQPGSLRVTIAHDKLLEYGGAERIVAIMAAALPEAPFWAVVGRQEVAERMGVADRYHTVLPERQWIRANYRLLTPLYPPLIRARPLPEADLLLTSSFAFAHHFRTRNDAPQLCYCYSPLRFAWSMSEAYRIELGPARRLSRAAAAAFRAVDRRAARRVTRYVAESRYVADQIERFYGRSADVIYPPVDCELFRPGEEGHDGYYLFSGRLLEAYKRPSLAVEAFRELPGERLVVAGDGPALPELRRNAPGNVEFCGQLDDRDLIPLMQRCAAVVFPSRDDFGLIPVEVMACGRPVLAYGAGGALETVVPGRTGEFFEEQSVAAIRDAIRRFDPDAYDPDQIRAHAERWRRERFEAEILAAVEETAAESDSIA
jgi:glycosyltransferase involved in cell wall biosynthesis